MPRPRTKGDPISIRLSLHHDQLLRLAAEQAGLPVTEVATRMLEGLLDPRPQPPGVVDASGRKTRAHDPTCHCQMCRPASAEEKPKAKAKR